MTGDAINLNGIWNFQPSSDTPRSYHHTIQVPSLVNNATPAVPWKDAEWFWYQREIPPVSDPQRNCSRVYLKLEQAQYATRIFINGTEAGGDISCYTLQDYDLTPWWKHGQANILEIAVGRRENLPAHSAVGNDFEKLSHIPGIWGDVSLECTAAARIAWLGIYPNLKEELVRLVLELEQPQLIEKTLNLTVHLREKLSGTIVRTFHKQISMEQTHTSIKTQVSLPFPRPWSPESPFLYVADVILEGSNGLLHRTAKHFGMRDFAIRGRHFYLNGKRIVLKGSNIAFHRLLSDENRGRLPWQSDWIQTVLADIPKAHNFSFFRIHNGHAYNRWYDIADENGILLQDEWMFWTAAGSKEQITQEFRAWLRDNLHHPSIVIWDPLNESESPLIVNEIIPEMKKLDPGRPWEHVDFREDHPYIYSLGPVVAKGDFGFSRSVEAMSVSGTPVMVNEFVWWWLDEAGNPSQLMPEVIERWLGRDASPSQLLDYQAYLAGWLCEFFRRLDVDAVMPFVYLSASKGATSHWFLGSLETPTLKPVMKSLAWALSPVAISIGLWAGHHAAGVPFDAEIFTVNDALDPFQGLLRVSLLAGDLTMLVMEKEIILLPGERRTFECSVLPHSSLDGDALLKALLIDHRGKLTGSSQKKLHIHPAASLTVEPPAGYTLLARLSDGEPAQWLKATNWPSHTLLSDTKTRQTMLFDRESLVQLSADERAFLAQKTAAGSLLILYCPESGIDSSEMLTIFDDLSVRIAARPDPERGGYDSVIHPEIFRHPLFDGLTRDGFAFWKERWGELVSQHSLFPDRPFRMLARCNLGLRIPAILEIPYGRGVVLISRVQMKSRLGITEKGWNRSAQDPAALHFWYNLLTLKPYQVVPLDPDFWILDAVCSDGQLFDIDDRTLFGRWAVRQGGEITLTLRFWKAAVIQGLLFENCLALPDTLTVHGETVTAETLKEIAPLHSTGKNQAKAVWNMTSPVTSLRLTWQAPDGIDHTFWKVTLK